MVPILEKIQSKPYYPSYKDVRVWFAFLNELLFRNKLKPFRYIYIEKKRDNVAICHGKFNKDGSKYCNLYIEETFRDFETFLAVLAHEMIHSHQWINQGLEDMKHGPDFFSWRAEFQKHNIPLQKSYDNKPLET